MKDVKLGYDETLYVTTDSITYTNAIWYYKGKNLKELGYIFVGYREQIDDIKLIGHDTSTPQEKFVFKVYKDLDYLSMAELHKFFDEVEVKSMYDFDDNSTIISYILLTGIIDWEKQVEE